MDFVRLELSGRVLPCHALEPGFEVGFAKKTDLEPACDLVSSAACPVLHVCNVDTRPTRNSGHR